MAWCSVKAQGQLYLYLFTFSRKPMHWKLFTGPSFTCLVNGHKMLSTGSPCMCWPCTNRPRFSEAMSGKLDKAFLLLSDLPILLPFCFANLFFGDRCVIFTWSRWHHSPGHVTVRSGFVQHLISTTDSSNNTISVFQEKRAAGVVQSV